MATKTVAFLQQAQAVAQRTGNVALARRHRLAGQPGELCRPRRGIACINPGANIPQHRSGLYRRQLIAVAKENHPSVLRQRVDQARHHRQVNH